MKYLFAITAVILAFGGVGTYLSYPDVTSDVPVLYWVTDANPARRQQVDLFHQWLVAQGYTTEAGEPMMELRLDTGNRNLSKQIVQGVSGVASDVMDISPGRLGYFQAVGMLTDVTRDAKALGFSPAQTYDMVEPEITVQGRQYTFPANVFVRMQWVNKRVLERHDQPVPPRRWRFSRFEKLGKRFVAAANSTDGRRTHFYAADVDLKTMFRSLGLSVFNETLTRCALDDPRFVRVLRLKYQWTFEDHIIPSSAQRESFDTASGYGGARFQLFRRGQYALLRSGRYALIKLREFDDLSLTVVEPPHGGFPNAESGTRATAIYAASEHKKLARHFLEYLASETYNMQVVRDADALPPNPKYTRTEAFRRPPEHPDEWGVHVPFAEAAQQIGIGGAYSPFVLHATVQRELLRIEDEVMNDRLSPAEAADAVARRINQAIDQSLRENPALKPRYEKLRERQRAIDARRERDAAVPAHWIENPFHRRYYRHRGWLDQRQSDSAAQE